MSQILYDHIVKSAAEKKKSETDWLHDVLSNLDKCSLATHVGKYSHPDSKVSVFSDDLDVKNDGYVITEEPKEKFDILVTSAGYASAANLLWLVIEDGRKLIYSLLEENRAVLAVFEQFKVDIPKLLQEVRNIAKDLEANSPAFTENRLRQVYFPTSEDYHLLTVLPSSSLLQEMKKSVDARKLSDEDMESKLNSYIKGLTIITYGGTNTINISLGNNKDGGRYYLLPSLPPQIEKRKYRYPKKNFFYETVFIYKQSELFGTFHKLKCIKENNAQIRESLEKIVNQIIHVVFLVATAISKEDISWLDRENYVNLPEYQREWFKSINDGYSLDLEKLEKLSLDFSRWLSFTYKKKFGTEAIVLSDEDVQLYASLFVLAMKKVGEKI